MRLAHALRRAGLSFGEAISRAWRALKLKAEMMVKPVSFFYLKDDGSERFAVGYYGATTTPASSGKPSPVNVVKYYDTLAGGWRSFRIDRLIID